MQPDKNLAVERDRYQVKVCGDHESNQAGQSRVVGIKSASPGPSEDLQGPKRGLSGPKRALLEPP